MTSFKIGIKTPGDQSWSTNSWRFTCPEDAEDYARDLAMRWTAVVDWTVLPSDDEPNRPGAPRP